MAKKKNGALPKEREPKPRVHKDLEGFNITINSLGEIATTFDIDRINEFLNKKVDDKKLRNREDAPKKNESGNRKSEEEE